MPVENHMELLLAGERSMRLTKVCLLGASFCTSNFGVNVLTLGTIRCLLQTHPDAAISIMDYSSEPEIYRLCFANRDLEIPLINIRFSKKPWQPNHILFLLTLACLFRLVPSQNLRRRILDNNRWLNHLNSMDLVTAISGGDSFSDIYGMERFFYISLPQILALVLGKRLVLLPQTLGPYRHRLTRAVTHYILCGAERIYTRDRQGLKTAESMLGTAQSKDKLHFSYDVGFAVEPETPRDQELLSAIAAWKKRGPLVGLNVSGLLFMAMYARSNMFGLEVDYKDLTYAMIKLFQKLGAGTVLLVPHVLGKEGSESDLPACLEIYRALQPEMRERIQVLESGLNERQTKFVIGHCDFFSGARMHACIAALSQSVPTVPLAYSDKFVGVMQTVGVESMVADPRHMSQEQILDLTAHTYQGRVHLREELTKVMPDVIRSTLQLFTDFAGESESVVRRDCTPHQQERTRTYIL
jgi:colanic acid/amylovoran biosynthesis protein